MPKMKKIIQTVCYVQDKEPDADQGECRNCCVYLSRGSKPGIRDIQYRTSVLRVVKKQAIIKNQESEFCNNKQGLDRIGIENKGCRIQYH